VSTAKKRRKVSNKLSATCSHCGVDAAALTTEVERLTYELQEALDRNTELKKLAGSDPEDIARMAVALVRARAEDVSGGE
jgi:hypothetical protein